MGVSLQGNGNGNTMNVWLTLKGRQNMRTLLAIFFGSVVMVPALTVTTARAEEPAAPAKIPVIFDTDIGDDIDDTWALVMLLKCPQFDVRLVTTDCLKSQARGKLIAKLLTIAGRTDIPIGLGPGAEGSTNQDAWTEGFQMDEYKGQIHQDGVQAIIDTINGSRKPITVIAVGPLQTMAAALEKSPGMASKAFFVGMHGSVYKGYGDSDKVSAEYNVRRDAKAAQTVLAAPWKKTTITPLDTCGIVHVEGDRFQSLKRSDDPLVKALLENYGVWAEKRGQTGELTRSSTLFDTVAVYLGLPGPKELVTFQSLSVAVTDDGYTRVDPAGARMSVATAWKDLDGFRQLLVETLLSPTVPGK
jgi:inosine-uridine nucleoside N-ribohydrolase